MCVCGRVWRGGDECVGVCVCVWRVCAFIVSYKLFVISRGRMFRDWIFTVLDSV